MRALVIQTSFLGDMVLTTPLIRELARRGAVDVVATPANAGLLAHNPHVRHVYRYDKRGAHAGARGFREIARLARVQADNDTAYLAQGSMRSAALAVAAGFSERVGFETSSGRWLYSRAMPYHREWHHAERLWSLAGHGDGARATTAALKPELFPGAAEEEQVQRLLDVNAHAGEPLLAVAPGSVWNTKRWPYFAALARRLALLGRVVVIGGGEDASLAAAIRAETFGNAIDASGTLSLLASAALIARSAVLVTNDSAPLHLASAMDTPTVALFGPTVPALGFGPLATASRVSEVAMLDCRPCDAHGPRSCPLVHWRCMRDLTVAEVLDAVEQVRRAGHGEDRIGG
jgi:heptosyltransferase II